jgi:fibronectin type 3 domain-containing protein
MGGPKKSVIRRYSLTLAIVLTAGMPCFPQPTSQELAALNSLPINGYVVFTNGDPTSEMGRGKGVYRFNLKQTAITAINTRGRWATIHPSGSVIAYAKPLGATDLPTNQTQFYHIVLTDPQGTELCRLTRDSIPNVFALAWTDDNRLIYGESATPDGMNGYPTGVQMIDMAGRVVTVKSNVTEIPSYYNPQSLIIGVSELAIAGTHILFRRGYSVYLADFNPALPQNGWTNEKAGSGQFRCGSTMSYDGTLVVLNTLQHNAFDLYSTTTFPTVQQNIRTVTEADDYHFPVNAGNTSLYKQWLVCCTQIDDPKDVYVVNKDTPATTRVTWVGTSIAPFAPSMWLKECTDATAPAQPPSSLVCNAISSTDAQLSWSAAVDPDCNGIAHYRIYRHNESTTTFSLVGISFTTSFEDLRARAGQLTTYGIQAVNSSGLASAMATVTVNESAVGGDHTPPAITEAHNLQANQVWVVFDEAIDSITAVSTSHYAIDKSVQVLSAGLAGNGRSAVLTTSNLTNGQTYTVTVSTIKDRASPANTLASASIQFTAVIIDTSGTSGDTILTLLTPDRDTTYHLGDTLKVAWDTYSGPVIVDLSVNNGKSYPYLLSPVAVMGTSTSWVIPNEAQYITDSAKVRITDYLVRTRKDVSNSRFSIKATVLQ